MKIIIDFMLKSAGVKPTNDVEFKATAQGGA